MIFSSSSSLFPLKHSSDVERFLDVNVGKILESLVLKAGI